MNNNNIYLHKIQQFIIIIHNFWSKYMKDDFNKRLHHFKQCMQENIQKSNSVLRENLKKYNDSKSINGFFDALRQKTSFFKSKVQEKIQDPANKDKLKEGLDTI